MSYVQPYTVTLKELSNLSGFSVSTVSKALNNKLDISIETRKAIKDIAKKHHYVPNNFAVALRVKRTQAVAVIIPQVNTDFYGSFLYNIEKVASSYGYRVILFQSFEENSKEKEYLKNSHDGSVDGIIILSNNKPLETAFPNNKNLPIEYVKILKDQTQDQLKKTCIRSFNNLLKHIN